MTTGTERFVIDFSKHYVPYVNYTVYMEEKWVIIEQHPNYAVSNLGRVRNVRNNYVLKNRRCGRKNEQYATVLLGNKNKAVHRLVANYFIGPRPDGCQVNHIDNDKMNPCVSNLEYISPGENVQHSYNTGRRRLHGERNPSVKLDTASVTMIKALYPYMTQTALAKRYGVSQTAIWAIVSGKCWKEVQ